VAKEVTMRETIEASFEEIDEELDDGDLEAGGAEELEDEGFEEEAEDDADADESADDDADEGSETDGDAYDPADDDANLDAGDDGADDSGGGDNTNQVPPPVSWRGEGKEAWANVPPAAQAEIYRREQEINNTLRETAQDRQFVGQYLNTMQPYMGLLQQRGVAPLAAIQNFMQTGAVLSTGDPQAKAQMVAQIIEEYGVDIPHLDDILSTSANNPQGQDNSQVIQRAVQQQMAPMNQWIQQQNNQVQQQNNQQAANINRQIGEFASTHEHYDDVKMQMADFFDVAQANQQSLNLEQAYEMALNLRPDLRKVAQQKMKAAQAKANKIKMAKKRRAASSLSNSDGGPRGGGRKSNTMHNDILSAIDELET